MSRRLVVKRISELKCKSGWKKSLDPETIELIAESLKLDGQRVPIQILRNGRVISGNHRIAAAIAAGQKYIECTVEAPPANMRRAEIVENFARRNVVGKERDSLIAELVDISGQLGPKFGKMAQKVPSDAVRKSGRPRNEAVAAVAADLGVTAEAVKMAVKRDRKRKAETRDDRAESVTRDKRGIEVPGHLLEYWQAKADAFIEIASLVSQAHSVLTRIEKDLPTILGGAVQFQSLRQSLGDARRQSRDEIPTYVCPECDGDVARSAACNWCHRSGVLGPRLPAGIKSAAEFIK